MDFEAFNRAYGRWLTSTKNVSKGVENNVSLALRLWLTRVKEADFASGAYLETSGGISLEDCHKKSPEWHTLPAPHSLLERVLSLYDRDGFLTGKLLDAYRECTARHGALGRSAREAIRLTEARLADGAGFTQDEKEEIVNSTARFDDYSHVHLRGTLFRSQKHQPEWLSTDNTGVMMEYLKPQKKQGEVVDKQHIAFGRIQRIFAHRLTNTSPVRVILQVAWFTQKGSLFNGEMPIVHEDPGSKWNKEFAFEFLDKAHAQNVVFWPRDMDHPNNPDFCALWSRGAHRPLDKL
jgi:hypothetical protein